MINANATNVQNSVESVLPRDRLGFTAPEVAKLVGISHDAILARCRAGDIKARKCGKLWVISRSEVLRICGEDVSSDKVLSEVLAGATA